jgi:uronate dehydrogenase
MIDPRRDRILVTGAAGRIGTALRQGLRAEWRKVRVTDLRPITDPWSNEEVFTANITDRRALERMMEGVTAVVHLAGTLGNYDLEPLFATNARGLFDVFEAARNGGVKRIVFASSNHTFGCYPIEERVTPAHPVRPDNMYGVFKVLGEAMLQNYYDRHGIRSVSLRIGTFRPAPEDQRALATWLSPADLCQLVDRSLRHPDPGCLVVNGYSGNRRMMVGNNNWDFLGYRPVDNAEDHVDALRAAGIDVDGPWEWPEHGGRYAREPERPVRDGS